MSGEAKFRRFLALLAISIAATTAFVILSDIAFGWKLSLSWALRFVVFGVIAGTLYYELRQSQMREQAAAEAAASEDGAGVSFLEPAPADEALRSLLERPDAADILDDFAKRLRARDAITAQRVDDLGNNT